MVSRAFRQFHETLEYKAALSQSEVLAAAPKSTSQSCPVYGNTTKANRYRKRHESHVVLRVIDAVRNIEYVSPKPSLHHNHHSRKCHKPIHTLSHNINVDLLNNPASKGTSG